jgi:hypothetical protein
MIGNQENQTPFPPALTPVRSKSFAPKEKGFEQDGPSFEGDGDS